MTFISNNERNEQMNSCVQFQIFLNRTKNIENYINQCLLIIFSKLVVYNCIYLMMDMLDDIFYSALRS